MADNSRRNPPRELAPGERSCVIVLADGARADVFENLLAAGMLPEIEQHVVERGSLRQATSTFTSTTGPAHVPMLTGCFCGTANVPGYRWFEPGAHRPGLPAGPWCLRSYNGPESELLNRDLSSRVRTLYELVENPVNVFGVLTRGLPAGGDLWRWRKSALWLWAHYRGEYVRADRAASAALLEAIERRAEVAFVAFPGIDWSSHYLSPFGSEAEDAYLALDEAVGAAARALRDAGRYESTLLVICSDHGHSPVRAHFDLPVRMESDRGLRVAYHSRKALVRNPEAVACVSGNGMAHVYAVAPDRREPMLEDLRRWLLAEEAIDILISRSGDGLLVESRRGRATLSEGPVGVRYSPLAGDPFGYPELPETMSFEEALTATAGTAYPDGLVQAAQIFRSPRCGDLVVSAAPGYDLRERHEQPEHLSSHGGLQADHMNVPLASSVALADGPLRTADVFPTVLEWLQRPVPAGIDGASRLEAVSRTRRDSVTPP